MWLTALFLWENCKFMGLMGKTTMVEREINKYANVH